MQSPWTQFFKNKEVEREIRQDIVRTYPDIDFFNRKSIQEMMQRILFVYAKENESLRYVQGMNELLAPMLYVLNQDCEEFSDADRKAIDSNVFAALTDIEYLEHDVWMIFEHLMLLTK
jgi:hypothetical protein